MKEATDWLKWISGWITLSASIDFPFQSPKLSRESSFTLSLDYAGLCKERSSKQVTDNFQRRALFRKIVETLKKINFQFDHRKFSEQRNSILSYYYRRVTRWGRRGLHSCTFLKVGRNCPDFGKRCTDFVYLCVKFIILSVLVEQFEETLWKHWKD